MGGSSVQALDRRTRLRVLSLPGRHFRGNPYFRLFCDSLEQANVEVVDVRSAATARLAFDIVHVHFPEHYVTEQSLAGALKWTGVHVALFLAAKIAGKRLVWSVHDVHPFRQRHRWLLRPYMALFRWLADAHVFLGRSSRDEFYAAFPGERDKPAIVVPHGPYPVAPVAPDLVARRRGALGLEGAFVVGYLGGIKPYKNPGALAAVPSRVADGRPVRLLVAGTADAASRADYEAACASLPPGMLARLDERFDDAALDLLIRCCDCVLLPYAKGWNSGLAMLVLSNGGRVLGSALPIFGELRERFGAPWVEQFASVATLRPAVEAVAARRVTDADRANLRAKLAAIDFAVGGEILARFYATLMDRRTGSTSG